jgi:hypothetical protein
VIANYTFISSIICIRCLKAYGMKLVNRDYFDMKTRLTIPEYNLDLINGFSASIASYENKLLLCTEIVNKLLHRKTIYEIINEIFNRSRDDQQFRDDCFKEIVGRIIMTTYIIHLNLK